MQTVANAAGVAVSTVSKALRNDPSLPQARCEAIQALARQMGYQPNPLVATLMAQLHHRRRRSDPQNLAWIDLWPNKSDRPMAMSNVPFLRGAQSRAQELGYGIEVYQAGAEGLSPGKLRNMLVAKGQWGLIMPPVPESAMSYELDMRGLTGVTIGTSLHKPLMHRVSPNHFQGAVLAWERLRSDGFRRIGIALTQALHKRVEGKWLGAFLTCQEGLPSLNQTVPLVVENIHPKNLSNWLRLQNPDAVLVAEDLPWENSNVSSSRILPSPSLAWLVKPRNPRGIGFLDYRPEQIGKVAVDMVVGQIHRNERGNPDHANTVLIDALWSDSTQKCVSGVPSRLRGEGMGRIVDC